MGICSSKEASSQKEEKKEDELTESDIREIKSTFTYDNMVNHLINNKNYGLYDEKRKFGARKDREFIEFGFMDREQESDYGWKAHISINDMDKDNLAAAWDVVKDIFIDEKLQVKIVKPTADFYNTYQKGKQITIYCHESSDADWGRIFNSIEDALHNANIQSDNVPLISENREIEGSRFLTYRNDDKGDGSYAMSGRTNNYNPGGFEDPFVNLEIAYRPPHFHP